LKVAELMLQTDPPLGGQGCNGERVWETRTTEERGH